MCIQALLRRNTDLIVVSSSLDDSESRRDWGWSPEFDIDRMTDDMFEKIIQNEAEFKNVVLPN